MSGGRYEFRVRWKRHGREVVTEPGGEPKPGKPTAHSQIFQTEKGARQKVETLERFDEDKYTYVEEGGRNPFDFPDLIAPPTIERRTVGEWVPASVPEEEK